MFRDNVIKPPVSGLDLFHQIAPHVTVADAISDLPLIENGCGEDESIYGVAPNSIYQSNLRNNCQKVWNHRCNRLGELMLTRCKAVPKRPGAGWLDLPQELKPRNLARHGDKRYDNRFGRLHWEGTFNTILTKVEPYWGRVFHPEQNRVISVRECARAQGFNDSVRFFGSLAECYAQVGNAVPPILGKVIGAKIIEAAVLSNSINQHKSNG
jgi:DNA (cytosine-5)-methyltransferase 1